MQAAERAIWTIGHSTRSIEDFIALLRDQRIGILADIRSFPGSRRYPHFNKELLAASLQNVGIEYRHFVDLGGRRKPDKNSHNTGWRHPAFRGYADYMETQPFKRSAQVLEAIASEKRLAYMCSEAPWWKCHRALLSDFLKARGWKVLHIMDRGKISEHPFTGPARAVQGELFYDEIRPTQ